MKVASDNTTTRTEIVQGSDRLVKGLLDKLSLVITEDNS